MSQELVDAIGQVITALRDWAPDKRNDAQKYDYISADAVLSRVGGAMARAGIAIIPEALRDDVVTTEGTNAYGKATTRHDATVLFNMHLMAGETHKIVSWVGRGTDFANPDKATYKAMTSGHKYFLMKLFCVGVGNDDSEHDNVDVANDVPTRPQRTQSRGPAIEHSAPASSHDNDVAIDSGERPAPSEGLDVGRGHDWIRASASADGGKTRLGAVVAAIANTTGDMYDNIPHALNALRQNEKLAALAADGKFEFAHKQPLSVDGAIELYDWLVARKTNA